MERIKMDGELDTSKNFLIKLGTEVFSTIFQDNEDGDDGNWSITFRPDSRSDRDTTVELFEEMIGEFGEVYDAFDFGAKCEVQFSLSDVEGFRAKYESQSIG
jgi:hypothetical protein